MSISRVIGAAALVIALPAAAGQNQAPVMNTPAEVPVAIGDELILTASAFDPDGDAITLSAEQLPGNAIFEDLGEGNGRITFTPVAADLGEHDIIVKALDARGAESQATIVIEVFDPNAGEDLVEEGCAVQPASPSSPWFALGLLPLALLLRRRARRA